MLDTIDVYGIIISIQPVGEYDKRILLLTKERGKISAFARGARRQGSALMGVTQVFACGKYRLREGKDSYSLLSAQVDNYFEDLKKDVETTCYGTYFLELAGYYSRESMSEPQMIKLLYLALLALTKPALPHPLTRRVYELRIMKIDGQYDAKPSLPHGETAEYTWNYVLTSPLEKLFTFVLTDEVFREFEASVDKSMNKYVDRKLNSLEILKTLIG